MGDKADYRVLDKSLDKNPNTVRKLLSDVKKGKSIARWKVRRDHHKIVDERAAQLLDELFVEGKVHTDGEAASVLKDHG